MEKLLFVIVHYKNIFSVSDDTKSETRETIGYYGIGEIENIFVIDTQGLQDPEGTDKDHLI